MFCSVLIRRLKEDVSFEDFRKAWRPEEGHFERPVRVQHAQRNDDEREIVSFTFLDVNAEELDVLLDQIAEGEKRHEQIAELIETTVAAGIYEVFDEEHLS